MPKSAAALRNEYGLMYDGTMPEDCAAEIAEADRRERAAHEIADLMALPPQERFAALARREWNCMRKIWRFGEYQSVKSIHDRAKLCRSGGAEVLQPKMRHLWKAARAETIPHLIAWAAFRDAHRKMNAVVEREAA